MAIVKNTGYGTITRKLKINGDAGAVFNLKIKTGSNYYNFDTNGFSSGIKELKNQKIGISGVYEKDIILPTVSSDTQYDVYISPSPTTNLNIKTGLDLKVGTIFQRGNKAITFNVTSAVAGMSINSDLTGGTITALATSDFPVERGTLTQEGAITKSSSPLLYIHDTPSWNRADGGNFTNSNVVESKVLSVNKTRVVLDSVTGISTTYYVSGENIFDDITVSAISGNVITLSAAQRIEDGDILTFTPKGWEVDSILSKIKGSGTSSLTMKMVASVNKAGRAAVTSVCDIDNFVSVKPNAFPVSNIECPAGGEVAINVVRQCTNYLGNRGDNDANLSGKSFKVHSVPAGDSTSRRPTGVLDSNGDMTYSTLAFAGSSSVSAGASMGSAGAGAVTYTAHANHIAGDEDYFYYKTVDAQSTPVTSATDQGKISITIV